MFLLSSLNYLLFMQHAFAIGFAAVVIVFGGVSLLTNQKHYRFLVKPRLERSIFPVYRSRPICLRSFTETTDCLNDFETKCFLIGVYCRYAEISRSHAETFQSYTSRLANSALRTTETDVQFCL